MVARLGFAVAIHVRPDILLADEALSAGDAEFARKCAERIAEMRQRMSFGIVTHSPDFARDIADRAIVLEHGRAVFEGTAAAAADFYQSMIGRDALSTVSA
jgi:ABC-2 type transport system ATP-binding protein